MTTSNTAKVCAQSLSSSKEIPLLLSHVILIVVVLCFIIYSILLLFPSILHKKKNLGRMASCRLIAHRGSRLEGIPENTIAAFKDAIKGGADVIELDVWLTLDGKVVVHHDDKLTRMTNGSCKDTITSLNYKDIPLISNMEQSDRCKEYKTDEYTKIPLLEEVLQQIPENVTINVEIKQNDDDLISKVQSLLAKYNRNGTSGNVYWFSLIQKINKKLQNNDSKIPTITSIEEVLKLLFFYYIGILPFVSIDDAVFGITLEAISLSTIREEKALKGVPDWFKRILALLFKGKPPHAMIAPRLFRHLRRRGIQVWFLGVNDEANLTIAIKNGATAVLTDRINWLSAIVEEKELQFAKV